VLALRREGIDLYSDTTGWLVFFALCWLILVVIVVVLLNRR
jgi:hypothetical protein